MEKFSNCNKNLCLRVYMIDFHQALDTSWFVSRIQKLFTIINKGQCATRSQKRHGFQKTEAPRISFLLTKDFYDKGNSK